MSLQVRVNETQAVCICLFIVVTQSGVTMSSSLRRRPNCFNLLFQLQFLVRSGHNQEASIKTLEAGMKEKYIKRQKMNDTTLQLLGAIAVFNRRRRPSPPSRARTLWANTSPQRR